METIQCTSETAKDRILEFIRNGLVLSLHDREFIFLPLVPRTLGDNQIKSTSLCVICQKYLQLQCLDCKIEPVRKTDTIIVSREWFISV